LGILSVAYIVAVLFGITVGAIFSVWGVLVIRRELTLSEKFRKGILEKVDTTTTKIVDLEEALDDDDDEEDPYQEQINGIQEQMEQIMLGMNATAEVLDGLPRKVCATLDGGLGRLTATRNKEEEAFIAGLDSLADQEWLGRLPPFFQALAQSVAKEGNPAAINLFRSWATKRPEVLSNLKNPQQQIPANGSGASGIDAYIT